MLCARYCDPSPLAVNQRQPQMNIGLPPHHGQAKPCPIPPTPSAPFPPPRPPCFRRGRSCGQSWTHSGTCWPVTAALDPAAPCWCSFPHIAVNRITSQSLAKSRQSFCRAVWRSDPPPRRLADWLFGVTAWVLAPNHPPRGRVAARVPFCTIGARIPFWRTGRCSLRAALSRMARISSWKRSGR